MVSRRAVLVDLAMVGLHVSKRVDRSIDGTYVNDHVGVRVESSVDEWPPVIRQSNEGSTL